MPTHARVIWSVFRRNFASYFINPTGYVFITVFILLGAMAAFWQRAFFLNNLANLDQLSANFPLLLLFFIPALTMNVWAEERRQGTDELLLTLPGRDADIVLGKYIAALGIYTVAVVFSLSHLVILEWLGDPDVGLIAATYFGYWLAGAALVAVGMVASLLTANATVAFIIGAVFCGAFVFVHNAENILGGRLSGLVAALGVVPRFRGFGDGLVPLASLLYFVALAVVMLYVNVALLGRRHQAGGEGSVSHTGHWLIRSVSLGAAMLALCTLVGRREAGLDATAERLHTLQPQTIELIERIPEDRPVFIQAFFSKEVPQVAVQTRKDLLNVLNRLDRVGGDRVRVAIRDTEPFTQTATDAAENYNIAAQKVMAIEASQRSAVDVFLGLVFTSGPEEFVIPFFHRGLPVEYELARSIRVVSQAERKKLGVVATDAKLFGGFDFQTMQNPPDWSIVAELRKQYTVEQIAPDGPYPDDLDALLAVMPSTMTQPQLEGLERAMLGGTPTLIFDDALPMFSPPLSPTLPKDANRNPFTSRGQPPSAPKGDFNAVLARIGLGWRSGEVVWSAYNPHPSIADAPPEIVFVSRGPDNEQPFNPDSVVSAGLQEVVMLFPSFLERAGAPEGASLEYTPLLKTGAASGATAWRNLVSQSFFGININPNPRRGRPLGARTLAMHVTGTLPPDPDEASGDSEDAEADAVGPVAAPDPAPRRVNVIVVADADVISETFFQLRRQGFRELNFDNVSFALNCIDVLAGDESFVALRKHRARHRTLTRVEARTRLFAERSREETDAAETRAAGQLVEAQNRLNERVAEVDQRTDIDQRQKQIMKRSLEERENRRLEVVRGSIEREKQQSIAKARTDMQVAIADIQRGIKWRATLLPPIPPLVLAIVMFAYRYKREKIGISERCLVGAKG